MAQRARAFQVSVGLAAAWTLLAASGVCEPLERLTMQARYLLRPIPAWTAPVTVVAIDEAALARYGRMPWSRTTFAALLDKLHAAGAAVVGIDVAFNEPARDPAEDVALARAMRRVPTVLPTFLAFAGAGDNRLSVLEPYQPFARAAVALGSVQPSTRQQREPWELEPYQDLLDRRVPAFPVAVVAAYRGQAWSPPTSAWIWQANPQYLAYRGPAHAVPSLSAADVLSKPTPPAGLAGRIVLVGATAIGLPDTNFAAPDLRNGPMAGVEISAHAIDNLLADRFWRRLDLPAFGLLLLALAAFPGRQLLAGSVLGRRRHGFVVAALAAWALLAMAAFLGGIWLEVVPVGGFLFTCYFGGLLAERGALLGSRNQLLERYASDLAAESRRQRERIEGELHDGVQQLLVALGRELRQARRNLHVAERLEARIERMEDISDQMLSEIQRVRRDLLPPALRREGFEGAIAAFADELGAREGLAIAIERDGWEPLPAETEVELYWLVREALNNAVKHAQASNVTVRLARAGGDAVVEVTDDGRGFGPPDLSIPPTGVEHSGLHRMWLRMRGRGGDLHIESRPGAGATLRFSLPLGEALRERERRSTW